MVTASQVIVSIAIAKEVVTDITIIITSLDSLQLDLHQHRVARANYQNSKVVVQISLEVFEAAKAQKVQALQVAKLAQKAMWHQNRNQDRARFFSTLLDAFQWLLRILELRDRISSCDFRAMLWFRTPYHSHCMY